MADKEGYVKLYRKALDNPIFYKPELWQIFSYCLLRAGHEESRIIFNGKEVILAPGSFVTGRVSMAKDLKQNPMTTYKRLKVLENLKILNIKSNNKFSIVTIENWELYQPKTKKATSKGTTKEQQGNTNNNIINNINNI